MQFSTRPLATLHFQCRIKEGLPAFVADTLADESLRGRREGPLIFMAQLHERRNVKRLPEAELSVLTRRLLVARGQPVIFGLAEGVIDLCQNQLQLPGAVITVIKRYGVKVVTEIAEVRKQKD